jgi:hypothetical protein
VRRAVRPGPDAGSRRPTAPQAAAAQMGCPVLGCIRAGHLVERAGIGDCLGMHQMPVLAVPYFAVGIGAQPSIPAALGATHRPHIDVVADLHHPDRDGPGGAVRASEADADLLHLPEMVQRIGAHRVTSATRLNRRSGSGKQRGHCRGNAWGTVAVVPPTAIPPEQMMSGSPLNSGGSTTSLACYIPGLPLHHSNRGEDVRVELAEWRRPDGTIAQGKSHLLPGKVLDIATRPATAADSFAEPGWQGAKAIAWALLGSGGDGRFAGLAPAALAGGAVRGGGGPRLAATLLQRLTHPGQLQVTVVLLGDIEPLGRAIRVADRQLIGLTSRDLGLVEVRNIHRDRLGSHRNSFLGRSALEAERHHFSQTNNGGRGNITAAEISFRPILPPRCRPVPAVTSGRLTASTASRPTRTDRWAVTLATRPIDRRSRQRQAPETPIRRLLQRALGNR